MEGEVELRGGGNSSTKSKSMRVGWMRDIMICVCYTLATRLAGCLRWVPIEVVVPTTSLSFVRSSQVTNLLLHRAEQPGRQRSNQTTCFASAIPKASALLCSDRMNERLYRQTDKYDVVRTEETGMEM